MESFSFLSFLENKEKSMISLLKELVLINSHSENLEGIRKVQLSIKEAAKGLKCSSTWIKTAPLTTVDSYGRKIKRKVADVLKLQKRPRSPLQILFMGHADTVYPETSSFQHFFAKGDTLYGPGVADMKGGLVIMLNVLEAIEKMRDKNLIGWTALINGDEEIGSIGSQGIIEREAQGKDCALVFEPAKEGKFIERRPSSTNYLFIARGQKAHAGRDFHQGKNAILPLAELAFKLGKISSKERKIQVNVATIKGGDALNIVPDLCSLEVNLRVFNKALELKVKDKILSLFNTIKNKFPPLEMFILSSRPPKELTSSQQKFHHLLELSGKILQLPIHFTESGGVTDGNTIALLGIPTIDSMGVVGKGLHTEQEEAKAHTLLDRAKLASVLIMLKVNALKKKKSSL